MKSIDEIYRELPDGEPEPRCAGGGPGRPCRRGCPATQVFFLLALALLPVVAVGLVAKSVCRAERKKHEAQARDQFRSLVDALELYRSSGVSLPPGEGRGSRGLAEFLSERPVAIPLGVNASGELITFLGRPIHYRSPGEHNGGSYDLWTADRKGRPDGIRNWR